MLDNETVLILHRIREKSSPRDRWFTTDWVDHLELPCLRQIGSITWSYLVYDRLGRSLGVTLFTTDWVDHLELPCLRQIGSITWSYLVYDRLGRSLGVTLFTTDWVDHLELPCLRQMGSITWSYLVSWLKQHALCSLKLLRFDKPVFSLSKYLANVNHFNEYHFRKHAFLNLKDMIKLF